MQSKDKIIVFYFGIVVSLKLMFQIENTPYFEQDFTLKISRSKRIYRSSDFDPT